MTDTPSGSSSPPAVAAGPPAGQRWPIAALCYIGSALAGGLLGIRYYLPSPPALSDGLVFSDLRHVGTVAGALVGSLAALLLTRASSGIGPARTINALLLISVGLLVYILCAPSLTLGLGTLFIIGVPWCFGARSLVPGRFIRRRTP